jgi:para-nitrobenzyl esterase
MKTTQLKSSILFGTLLALASCQISEESNQDINIQSVPVTGGLISGVEEHGIKIFKGIPYAAPPISDLRWQAPAPVIEWEGVKNCNEFAASPMQVDPVPFYMWSEEFLIPSTPIDEDGLYLNVWTPSAKTTTQLPVLVWIHGGGFQSGSGSVPIYDGTAMAQKDLVFVSINYRLGVFGFLAHPELSAASEWKTSGNYGLMDQIAALEWVQDNIHQFGGDPNNVTIAGQSAGAASVAFLVASPLAKGLFSKAIAQSGAGILSRSPDNSGISLPNLAQAESNGLELMEKLGASSLADLRAIPARELLEKGNFRGQPIVDGKVIPKPIAEIYQTGQQNHISLLTGWNREDGIIMGEFQSPEVFRNQIIAQWGEEKGNQLLAFYPAFDQQQSIAAQKDLQRDIVFGAQNYALANMVSHQGLPVYVYRFERDLPDGDQPDYGAFHTGEVPYAYDNLSQVNRPFEEADFQLASMMSTYWANFAKSGNPNGVGLPEWPKYLNLSKEMMIFGDFSRRDTLSDTKRLDFLVQNLSPQ